ncbi:MAG: hypothetical protein HYT76_08000 [Deltaproteobacteria bacterium]|nr:hypothetical protein [Deltaproteobacteria bacterium]
MRLITAVFLGCLLFSFSASTAPLSQDKAIRKVRPLKKEIRKGKPFTKRWRPTLLPQKKLFMITDRNWQDVLSLVPIVTKKGTFGGRLRYAMIVYHPERTPSLQRPIARFIDDFEPFKIYTFGEIPSSIFEEADFDLDDVEAKTVSEYLDSWSGYSTVIYVENNYSLALLASSYAALREAPLIVVGSALDRPNRMEGKNVVRVGTVSCPSGAASCEGPFSANEISRDYVTRSGTNKIILVNSNDLNQTTKVSLVAPILAAGRKEVLLSTTSTDHLVIDSYLNDMFGYLGFRSGYLTILAHPSYVPMKTNVTIRSESRERRGEYIDHDYPVDVDNRFYGTPGENLMGPVEFAVGRIFGKGSSLYVARSLFFGELPRAHERALFATLSSEEETDDIQTGCGFFAFCPSPRIWSEETRLAIETAFPEMNFLEGTDTEITEAESLTQEERNELYRTSHFIYYHGHAGSDGLSSFSIFSPDVTDLSYPFLYLVGCSTCNTDSNPEPFCARNLQEGAMGLIGTFDDGLNMGYTNGILRDMYLNGLPMGEVIKNVKNSRACTERFDTCIYEGRAGNMRQILIGDPLLQAKWW